jgi:hypothetical protein
MESLRIERLDHFGLVVSVIKHLRLIEMIDARLIPDTQEEITPGEAIAGTLNFSQFVEGQSRRTWERGASKRPASLHTMGSAMARG